VRLRRWLERLRSLLPARQATKGLALSDARFDHDINAAFSGFSEHQTPGAGADDKEGER